MTTKLRPKIGLLPTGLNMYFHQYPNLKQMGMAMYDKLVSRLSEYAEVVSPGLVDTYEAAVNAADVLSKGDIDILLIFPFGYTTGMMMGLAGPSDASSDLYYINMETGERIAAFNLKNVKPDKYQMESFARGILDMMKDMAAKRDKENK